MPLRFRKSSKPSVKSHLHNRVLKHGKRLQNLAKNYYGESLTVDNIRKAMQGDVDALKGIGDVNEEANISAILRPIVTESVLNGVNETVAQQVDQVKILSTMAKGIISVKKAENDLQLTATQYNNDSKIESERFSQAKKYENYRVHATTRVNQLKNWNRQNQLLADLRYTVQAELIVPEVAQLNEDRRHQLQLAQEYAKKGNAVDESHYPKKDYLGAGSPVAGVGHTISSLIGSLKSALGFV